MSLKDTQDKTKLVIREDEALHDIYVKMEDMVHGRWNLPAELNDVDGIHKMVSSKPFNAMNTLRRVLSKDIPKINVRPIAPTTGSQRLMDKWDKGLTWLYDHASERRGTELTGDLAWSMGLYGQTVGQTMYIPHEIEARKAFGGDTKRLEDALLDGPFVVELHNPRNAHVFRSSYMMEAVVTKKMMRYQDILNFWGDLGKKLTKSLAGNSKAEKERTIFTVFDYEDHKERYVWAVRQEHENTFADPDDEGAIALINGEAHDIPFFRWFSRLTGAGLEGDPRWQISPMLKPIVDTGKWDTLNTLNTMIMSKSVRLFGRPAFAEEGNNPNKAEIDYDDDSMGTNVKVPAGNTLRELRPEVLDEALLTLVGQGTQDFDEATVSRLIQTGEFGDTSGVGINIITESAIASMNPQKRGAERSIEDIVKQFLLWIEFKGEPLTIDGAADIGEEQIVIRPEDINPRYLYVDVELSAVAPTDMVAKANAGQMMQAMGYPAERVFEQMGDNDPTGAVKQSMKDAIVAKLLESKLAEVDIATQMKAQAAQLQLQQQVAQQQQQQQGLQPAGPPGTSLEGQGSNPNAGGQSVQNSTDASFEAQNAATRDGTPLQ